MKIAIKPQFRRNRFKDSSWDRRMLVASLLLNWWAEYQPLSPRLSTMCRMLNKVSWMSLRWKWDSPLKIIRMFWWKLMQHAIGGLINIRVLSNLMRLLKIVRQRFFLWSVVQRRSGELKATLGKKDIGALSIWRGLSSGPSSRFKSKGGTVTFFGFNKCCKFKTQVASYQFYHLKIA